jgi:hypothetical protein
MISRLRMCPAGVSSAHSMKREFTSWLRLIAIGLALMLAGDATGAFAAVAMAVPKDDCCHRARSVPSCPIAVCAALCGLPRAASIPDESACLKISTVRERWVAVDEIGSVRAEEPPVPPPRG